MYPEPSNQDQNQRKRHTDIFFLRCDFRILFLVTANAMYHQDPGEEDEIDQFVLFITEMLLLTEKIQMIVEILPAAILRSYKCVLYLLLVFLG